MLKASGVMMAIAAVFAVLPSAATSDGCTPRAPADIEVTAFFEDPEYDFSRSFDEIEHIVARSDEELTGPRHPPLGLTVTRLAASHRTQIGKVSDARTGEFHCARLDALKVSFGTRQPTVYVAREFPRGSCAFNQVLEHEEEHLRIARGVVEEFADAIEREVRAAVGDVRVVRADNAEAATKMISRAVAEAVDKVMTEAERALVGRNRAFDSLEEYRRLARACDGQIAEIAAAKDLR